ncbi:MAG: uncharacterized protein A8A55_3525, partial [Amphiamblys sp. WSBS2006]
AVIDIKCFSDEEKEEAKKKEFAIRKRLYMRNTGIFFLECLWNTVFIPVIEIEVDRFTKNWGGFGKTTGTYIKTNALVENNINPEIKQKAREMVAQKETVVEKKNGYQKFVFEEDPEHEEQTEPEESSKLPITEYQDQELCFEERSKKYLSCYDFSNYLYGNYED